MGLTNSHLADARVVVFDFQSFALILEEVVSHGLVADFRGVCEQVSGVYFPDPARSHSKQLTG